MSMETNYKIYVHIAPNGKRYYGITKQKVEARWNNGKGYSNNDHFTNAINYYDWDNFEHIVIARGLTEEEAKWLEIELIREHDTTNRDKGYNITKGGDDNPTDNEEVRKKIGEAHRGHKHSEEHRKKISEACKGKNTGKNNPKATKVYCVELEQYFDTVTEASEYVGCCISSISKVLNPNKCNKTAKGYHWVYAEEVNEENINKVLSEEYNERIITLKDKISPKATKVYCVELDMYFNSVTEASKFVGCSKLIISSVLHGRLETAKGYHWLYAEDVEKLDIENNKVS